MRLSDPGESAIELPWLSPGAASLVALARSSSPSVWLQIRHDPGAVLLIARHLTTQSTISFPEELFRSAAPLQQALLRLQDSSRCQVDWSRPEIEPVYRAAIAYAEVAERIATRIGSVEPACPGSGACWRLLDGWRCVPLTQMQCRFACVNRSSRKTPLTFSTMPGGSMPRHWPGGSLVDGISPPGFVPLSAASIISHPTSI